MKCHKVRIVSILAGLALLGGCGMFGEKNVAYPGAPPTIPHSIEKEYRECLICHKNGILDSPKTEHPKRTLCRQCHVPSNFTRELAVENNFRSID